MCISNQRSYIVREYEEGRSSTDIARELNCSSSRICQILREEGVEIRFKMKPSKEITLLEPKMIEMWDSGIHLENIAKELKIGAMTVKSRLNKLGIITSKKTDINKIMLHSEEIIQLYAETGNTNTVGTKFDCSSATIQRVLQKNGIIIKKKKLYTVNENFFEKIDTQEKAWLVGLWYSDGCCVTNHPIIKLQLKDRETIEKVKELLNYTGPIRIHKQKPPNSPGYIISIYNNKLKQDLVKLGCLENKSLVLEYPNENKIPLNLSSHFIRGILDGDGSISSAEEYLKDGQPFAKWFFSFIGTASMMNGILNVVENNVIVRKREIYKHNKKNDSNTYQLRFNGEDCVKVLEFIYKDAKCYMERKFQMMKNLIDYFKFKSGKISEFKFYSLSKVKPKKEGSVSDRISKNKENILNMKESGKTVLEISKILDCHPTYIYKILNQSGSNLRN